jgi:7,8-didemethyl-8-hydroxy-5-deazariboflavin synthase CofG subunit
VTAPPLGELLERLRKAVDGEPLARGAAVAAMERVERAPETILEPLLEAAQEAGIRGHGRVISVSRNVFIPLTNLCRDRCAYCTFAVEPDSPRAKTWLLREVRDTSRRAAANGCLEALFCLGDKPEVAYRGYRAWLDERGYARTTEYLADACRESLAEGLFPHSNAGILSAEELAALRPLNASMGLMLESTSPRLRERGQAHFHAPDKEPSARLRMTREAGELRIPFTSGILVGIGENAEERIDTLLAIRELHEAGGHVQEVIVQNFHPKPGTPMAHLPAPSDALMAGSTALARLVLGPAMNLQAPPNLSPTSLELLVRAGINDWGGVSPLTIDFINPEMPWPELDELRARTEAAGYELRDRLCVYPEYVTTRPDFFDPEMLRRLRAVTDDGGWPAARKAGAADVRTPPTH